MQFVLEAQPQGLVMDPDDPIDLNAIDVVSFVIPRAETRQQEIITRGEPEGTDTVSPCVLMKQILFEQLCECVVPRIICVSLLKPNISHGFQLQQ